MKSSKKQKYSPVQIGALAQAFDKDFITIKRWISKNDDRLTSERAKNALQQYGGNEVKIPNVQIQLQ